MCSLHASAAFLWGTLKTMRTGMQCRLKSRNVLWFYFILSCRFNLAPQQQVKPQRDGQKKRKTGGDEPESKMNKTEGEEAEGTQGYSSEIRDMMMSRFREMFAVLSHLSVPIYLFYCKQKNQNQKVTTTIRRLLLRWIGKAFCLDAQSYFSFLFIFLKSIFIYLLLVYFDCNQIPV